MVVSTVNKIFIPTNSTEDWRSLLADPDKQWKTGYSAKSLAYCWEEANGFPERVRNVFSESGIDLFQDIELLLAFPEYKVPLPGGSRPSQNDIFILAKGNKQLVSITVEGKVSEPFGETVAEWEKDSSKGKQERLKFLRKTLQLENAQIDAIRYQLLHRTASAIIEAEKFKAKNALMLVHSFSQSNKWVNDYSQFLALFGLDGKENPLVGPKNINGIDLYFGWVRGDKKYLDKGKMTKEGLIKNITHKLEGLKERTLNEVDFFVDYIREREKNEILLSTKELEKLKTK